MCNSAGSDGWSSDELKEAVASHIRDDDGWASSVSTATEHKSAPSEDDWSNHSERHAEDGVLRAEALDDANTGAHVSLTPDTAPSGPVRRRVCRPRKQDVAVDATLIDVDRTSNGDVDVAVASVVAYFDERCAFPRRSIFRDGIKPCLLSPLTTAHKVISVRQLVQCTRIVVAQSLMR